MDTALAEYYAERVRTISEQTGVKERAIRDWFDYRLITERGLRNQVVLEPDKIGLELEAIEQLVNAHLVRQERRGGAIYFELAHDRLVRPVLDNNTAWKAEHLSVLQRQASRWEREGYKEYLLLHGEALAEAEAWAAANPDQLTEVDRKFLQASGQLRAKEEQERAMAEQAIRLEAAEKLADAERQRRESAEKLAETERQRSEEQAAAAAQLRQRAVYLAGALVVALLLLVAAAALAWYAQGQRNAAEAGRSAAQAAQSTAEAAAALESAARQEEARQRKSAEIQREDAKEQRRIAEERRQRAEQDRIIATARQFAAQATNLKVSQPDLALLLSLEGDALAGQIAAQTGELVFDPQSSLLDVLAGSQLVASFQGSQDYLASLAFSQDGSLLVSGDYSGNVVLWDIASGQSLTQTTVFDPALSLASSPDGSLVVVGDYYGGVHLWNVHGGQVKTILDPAFDLPSSVAFSPDGRLLAAAGNGLHLGQTSSQLLTSITDARYQNQLAFSQDGDRLAAVNLDGAVELWDTSNPGLVARLVRPDPTVPIVYLAFTPVDEASQLPLLLAVEAGGRLVAWDLTNGREQPVSYQASGSLFAYSPVQSVLASDTPAGGLQICRLNIQANLACTASRLLVAPPGRSSVLAISPGGGLLASGREDGSIIVWQIAGNALTGPPLQAHKSAVVGLAFQAAQGGLRLVSASGGADKSLRLWDLQTRQPDAPLVASIQKSIDFVSYSLAYSPDGKILASGDQDGDIRLWDTGTFTLIRELSEHQLPVQSVAFSPNGSLLAAGSQDGTITLWDSATGLLANQFFAHSGGVNSLAFSPDGKVLASGGGDGRLVLWDATTGQLVNYLSGDFGILSSLAFSRDGRTLAAGGGSAQTRAQAARGASLLLWDLANPGGDPRTLQIPVNVVSRLAFSPDGQSLASGSPDGEVFVWDFSDRSQISRRPLAWEIGSVTGLAFSLDSRSLIVGSDGDLSLWDVGTLARKGLLPDGDRLTAGPVIDPSSGRFLAAGNAQGQILFWSLAAADVVGEISSGIQEKGDQEVTSLAIDPNGETLATGGSEGTILLWDLSSRQPLGPALPAHDKKVTGLVFSAGGDLFASGGMDGSVKIWDPRGREMSQFSEQGASVSAMANSPKIPLLAFGLTHPSGFSTLYLWDLADPDSNPEPVSDPLTEDGSWPILSMAFDAAGGRLAVGRGNGMISLWDLSQRAWLPPLSAGVSAGQEIGVKSLAFSADGAWLASGLADGSLILWSGQDLQQAGHLAGHTSSVDALVFSPDSKILASAGADTSILLWEVDPRRWASLACRAVNRNLSWAEWVKYVDPHQDQAYRVTCPGNFIPGDVAAHYLERARAGQPGSAETKSSLEAVVELSVASKDPELLKDICALGIQQDFDQIVQPACNRAAELIDIEGQDPLTRANFYADIGDTAQAEQAFMQAAQEALDSGDQYSLNNICWQGSLHRFADAVLPACQQGVEIATSDYLPLVRDSRGLARALTGDYAGAIEDFQFLVDWLRGEGSNATLEEWRDQIIARRERFIAALAQGQNPIDEETLQELANESF